MSFDAETTRVVRAWLDEGVAQLPDRILDAVLDQLPANPQHRARWWSSRRSPNTRASVAAMLATAAAMVVISLIGLRLLSAGGTGAAPTIQPDPSPATELPSGYDAPLEPGRYALGQGFPADLTFEVAEEWSTCGVSAEERGVCRSDASIAFLVIESVVVHPCDTRLHDPPAGRSVDAFLSALADLAGFTMTEPVEVRRGALAGRQVTLTAPAAPACPELRTYSVPGRTNGVHAGEVNVIEAFDLGDRVVAVIGSHTPGVTSTEALAEMRTIMDSVEVWP